MKIIYAKDYRDMSRKAANIISAQVILKPDAVLGLATGSSPLGIYEQLIKWYNKGDVDFGQCVTFNLDEYYGMSASCDQSYHYFMQKNFFSAVNVPAENINVPNGEEPNIEKECARYEAALLAAGGVDLQLLGMGVNGHIGFNEPDEYFSKGTHCVTLTDSTIEANKRFFASADEVPRKAYTMGVQSIMRARRIIMVVSGENKAEALRAACFGPVTPRVPASILQLHDNVSVVADEAALSLCGRLL